MRERTDATGRSSSRELGRDARKLAAAPRPAASVPAPNTPHTESTTDRNAEWTTVGASLLGALASLAVVPPALGYDPQAWLLWGRELGRLELSTAEGPAFKPLAVAVAALLAPLGGLAAEAWTVVARTGALVAVAAAAGLARALGGPPPAAVLAGAGVALAGGFAAFAGQATAEGWGVALALLAAGAALAGRPRAALAAGAALGLLRVEAWPFLAAGGALLWLRRPQDRPLLLALAVALPAAWLVPEWLGSGDPLRSSARARVPNPGQPALAAVPALAALGAAAAVPLVPLGLAGLAALLPGGGRGAEERGRAAEGPGRAAEGPGRAAEGPGRGAEAATPDGPVRAVALAGLAWILLVAAMSQAGFSGEGRYALPGAALVSVAGAVVLARLARGHGRAAAAVLLLVLLAAAAPRLARLPDVHAGLAHAAALDADLARAVAAAGGRDAVLACGRPYVGPYRGPLLAWHLDVQKRAVGFAPRAPGTVFRSALRAGGPVEPTAPAGFAERARAGRWQVLARCAGAGAGAQPRSGRSG